jgi:protocatechuate 3,4-dioxygenase beta subunit
MSFSAPCLSAALLTILCLSASLCAQSTTTQATKVPLGSISGRVTIKDKGVPGVAIGLRKGDIYTPFEGFQRATTDQDGFYRISNLAPGNYSITICAPAFVIPDGWGAGKQKGVLVGEGENVEGINFALVRGGVITGRVTDADGRPVIDQQVNVYPAQFFEQRVQRTIYAVGSVQTDDRGIYRVFGLAAGRYKVAVGRSDDELNVTYNQSRNVFYKQVFHPDVSDQAKATIIEVSEGGEAKDVDITVGRTVQTFKVSGLLVDENGQPVPNLRFGLQRQLGHRVEYMNNSAMANSRGEFIAEGLVPGRYAVFLFSNQNNGLRVQPFNFDVVDHDLTGLTVKLTKGASIAGIVVLENPDQAVFMQLLKLQLRAFGVVSMGSEATFASGTSSALGADGSFRLAGLPPGTINMSFAAIGSPLPPKGFTITRIERDGVVSSRGLEVKDGEQLIGVRVFVSYGTATLRGVVTLDNESFAQKGRIFVKLTKTGNTLSNLRPPIMDERGHFLIEGIPAGTYELIMIVNLPGQVARNLKREVILQDGQTTDLTINIDSSEPAKP